MVDKTAKSPEEAKAGAEKSQAKGIKDRSDLASDFGGANPKYYLGLDSYGRVRQLNEVVGGATVQRFLIVDSNGIDYQVINADQIVQQVRKYFKNNRYYRLKNKWVALCITFCARVMRSNAC